MAILSLDEHWELMNGEKISCREVFAKLKAKELDKTLLCRSDKSRKWKEVSARFRIIRNFGILHSIGQGGYGKVYKAVDIRSGRIVAIKVPTENFLTNYIRESKNNHKSEQQAKKEAKAKIGQVFSQEAVITARLNMCPHVVAVIDHCVNIPFIALEFCSGGTLRERIKNPYTSEDILQWSYQISLALQAAHSLEPDHLIHRDLKPANVLIHDDILKVSDFGTSKMSFDSKSLQSLDGGYTPFYAAPEAFDGKASGATDIWSFGVILYQFVSQCYPFQGESTPELIMKINFKPHSPIRETQKIDVPPEIIALIDKCLTKKPQERPSASECVAILDGLLHPEKNITVAEPLPVEIVNEVEEAKSCIDLDHEESDEDDENASDEIDFGSLGW